MLNKYYSNKKPPRKLAEDLTAFTEWKEVVQMMNEVKVLVVSIESLGLGTYQKKKLINRILDRIKDKATILSSLYKDSFHRDYEIGNIPVESESKTILPFINAKFLRLAYKRVHIKNEISRFFSSQSSKDFAAAKQTSTVVQGGYPHSNQGVCFLEGDDLITAFDLKSKSLPFSPSLFTGQSSIVKSLHDIKSESFKANLALFSGKLVELTHGRILKDIKNMLPTKTMSIADYVEVNESFSVVVGNFGNLIAMRNDGLTYPLGLPALISQHGLNSCFQLGKLLLVNANAVSYISSCSHWVEVDVVENKITRKIPVPEGCYLFSKDVSSQTIYLAANTGEVYRLGRKKCFLVREAPSNFSKFRQLTAIKADRNNIFVAASPSFSNQNGWNVCLSLFRAGKGNPADETPCKYSSLFLKQIPVYSTLPSIQRGSLIPSGSNTSKKN